MEHTTLPSVPVLHGDLLQYVQSNNGSDMGNLLKPYNEYDAVLRRVFAQEPDHPALKNNHLNLVPIYDDTGSTNASIRARDLESESPELKEKYLLPLEPENRRPNGSPAVVQTVPEFQTNFSLFTEGSLSDMDWSNVVVAGSAVVTCLMPVPEKYRDSKRSMRRFYHEEFAPASDVDLFLYGLTEDQALEKIRHIEKTVQGSILQETTTIRTKNTITIASQYPTRHVQIVLRIYKSIAEILTGFDVDCSCAAYDGKQIYVAPRALASYITQVNQIDLTRRSPSYENRLSKYSHRGFEVFWPGLERSRIDPTVFERSFARTVGLARLLVLEQLPKPSDRESYIEKRRKERGRPSNRDLRRPNFLYGNIKNDWEDEAPEWLEEDAISDYHTFTIPYGQKFHARKIEKMLYTKDLLLNAEWNRSKERQVNLHRHPAFFGDLDDVIHDCCGYCPVPVTDEEKEVAEQENKIYISGDVTFMKDDPGRQEIGSFNPITETDWTEMAYVGNTERLCQAIVDHNLEEVQSWLGQETSDPNTRDYTGRTPLQLACMTSTPEIVQCLVDHGARLISRIADGRTALHLAASRGAVQIARILLSKSEQNEEEEAKKEELRNHEKRQQAQEAQSRGETSTGDSGDESDVVDGSHDENATTRTVGSYVEVGVKDWNETPNKDVEDENQLEPDIYDVNVQAWDHRTSPLHLAILNGHVDVVEELVGSFGADVLLPVKLLGDSWDARKKAILTLVLALRLPLEKAKAMTQKLLQLGASPTQAELNGNTALNYVVACRYTEILDVYIQLDQPSVKRIINRLVFYGYQYNPSVYSAFTTAIDIGDTIGALKLLDAGADVSIRFNEFIESAQTNNVHTVKHNSAEENRLIFEENIEQPVITSVRKNLPELALELLARGVDPNTLTTDGFIAKAQKQRWQRRSGTALLDYVRRKLYRLRSYKGENLNTQPPKALEPDDDVYLGGLRDGTYEMWAARLVLKATRMRFEKQAKCYEKAKKEAESRAGLKEKMNAVNALVKDFEKLEQDLLERGAKTFKELFPHIKDEPDQQKRTFEQEEPAPFKIKYTFRAPGLTDIKEKGYMRLFEAAWCGDLTTIKSLTLSKWGENNDQLPLQIAVEDSQEFSPFSVALLRGHLHVAKSILEIAEVQYKPPEDNTTERFWLDGVTGGIESEIIDETFTIENIGEAAAHVECRITPLDILHWNCPSAPLCTTSQEQFEEMGKQLEESNGKLDTPASLITYAIWKDDIHLLTFLLELGQQITTHHASADTSSIFRVPAYNLAVAERLGRIRCMEEIIRRTGGCLPIDDLVQRSGVEVHDKPKYYQGLSIHGKKRPEWADAGRGVHQSNGMNSAPLLTSAMKGNLESTEWFLGTAPGRYYKEFARAHKHDKELKILEESKLGLEGTIMNWLGLRNHLVLHCAVLSKPTVESDRLVQYLVDEYPTCLETKSVEGYTPLQLAFSVHRMNAARILINAGSNQTVRDRTGRNLFHMFLCSLSNSKLDEDAIRGFLKLVDPKLVPSMLTERCSDDPGSLTPIAYWMRRASVHRGISTATTIVEILLDLADSINQKPLEMLNGAGNTPVHDAIKSRLLGIFKLMIDRRPDLLHREDATGCTPFELAVNLWTNEATSEPPRIPDTQRTYPHWRGGHEEILERQPESFIRGDDNRMSNLQIICNICRGRGNNGAKRKLVTLHEANEVAKRLASRPRQRVSQTVEVEQDEVSRWHNVWYFSI